MPALKFELAVLDMLKMPLVSFHFILPPFKENDRFLRNKNWFAITFLPLLKTHLRHLLLPRLHFQIMFII